MSKSASHAVPATVGAGLLRSPVFDSLLIGGTFLLAMSAWLAVGGDAAWFEPILYLDLWLLGYHHVIATYTRIGFDRISLREHRFYVFVLPWLVIGAVLALVTTFGVIAIASIYLYWQWFHYLRQSEGISKAYLGRAGSGQLGNLPSVRVIFYGLPLASFLTMIGRQPDEFLWMPVFTFHVPEPLLATLWAGVGLAAAWFVLDNRQALLEGRFSRAYLCFLASHFGIFLVGYALTEDLNRGWLAINIWHNAQYLIFVWLFNVKRFSSGVDRERLLISYISQPQRVLIYVLVLIAITSLIYTAVNEAIEFLQPQTLVPLTIAFYQTLNFHHYIVDSVIWKLRRKPIRATLELA